jgi:4-diphosphocytidyl-2-C-methyl-D-erythritol kinase
LGQGGRGASAAPSQEAARNALTLRAPAKVNLTLEVIGRLPNGYHAIRSVMVRLPHLADIVRVDVRAGPADIRVRSTSAAIPVDDTNICHRAARHYLEHAGETARIVIDIAKSIPVAAGLGGGSSDAAAVLLALNRHFRQRIAPRALVEIGAALGKDVPFFIAGAAASHASGMGERLRAIGSLPRCHFLIVNPRIAISTKEAYDALGRGLWFIDDARRIDRSQRMVRALGARDLHAIAAALYNDFEIGADGAHPVLNDIRQSLLAFGARGALMSGSGSTVFGLFASLQTLRVAQAALQAHYPAFFVERG